MSNRLRIFGTELIYTAQHRENGETAGCPVLRTMETKLYAPDRVGGTVSATESMERKLIGNHMCPIEWTNIDDFE